MTLAMYWTIAKERSGVLITRGSLFGLCEK